MKLKTSLIAIGIFIVVFSCEYQSQENKPSNLAFINTIAGGCNGQSFSLLKSATDEQKDTVIFTVRNDTLDLFTGINYICCAPFVSEVKTSNDTLIVKITDTCNFPAESCYCRCMCYYTWNFLFTGFEKKEYHFKIILNDPQQESPVVLWEGTFNPQSL